MQVNTDKLFSKDQDASTSSSPTPYLGLFDLSPETFIFRDPIPSEIESRRADLSDLLLFDILLNNAGVDATEFYPPQDPETLSNLCAAIDGCQFDQLKKDCLIYYLLKAHPEQREGQWMSERCIPPHFAMEMDAYWYLDHGTELSVRFFSLLLNVRENACLTTTSSEQ
jgi:hypothetical protein